MPCPVCLPSLSLSPIPGPLQVLEAKPTDTGGIKTATAVVSGPGAFGQLRWESGVHRATMVPDNDKHGRMQTGTAVVIVLPEASDVCCVFVSVWAGGLVYRSFCVCLVFKLGEYTELLCPLLPDMSTFVPAFQACIQ